MQNPFNLNWAEENELSSFVSEISNMSILVSMMKDKASNLFPTELINNRNLQIFFVCLVYRNCRCMKYLVFEVSRICANYYFMITNQSYISQPFTKNRPLKRNSGFDDP